MTKYRIVLEYEPSGWFHANWRGVDGAKRMIISDLRIGEGLSTECYKLVSVKEVKEK